MQTTIFKNGGSQAMRIPAQFRFEGDVVDVEWDDRLDALVVREVNADRMATFFRWLKSQPQADAKQEMLRLPDGRPDLEAFFADEDAA